MGNLILAAWAISIVLILSNGNVDTNIDKSLNVIREYEYKRGQSSYEYAVENKVGNCLALSYVLQEELESNGVKSKIVCGTYMGQPHAWIEVEGGYWLEATKATYIKNRINYRREIEWWEENQN